MSFTRADTAGGNICVIWIDDMIDIFTWRTAFGLQISTPNIDRFMSEGTRFSNAYATVPLCAPCRAELATGLSPFRTGLVDLNRFWRDILPPTAGWQYDLRRNGFRTFTTGKVDSNYKPMPHEYARILFHEQPEAKDAGRRSRVKKYLDKGPGIAGVLRSGVEAAGEVLENDLTGRILAGEVLGDRDALPELFEDWDAWRESH